MSEQLAANRFSGRLIIGLTGNIATGKSAVMRLATQQGALTIDADQIVHDLENHDAELQAAIAVAFGHEVRLDDGRIDRRALGKIVFDDAQAMRDLEGIVHPAVYREVARRIHESEAVIVFIEAIKLLDGALAKICHQVWVTRCSRQRQLDRLRICRGMGTETAVTRIKAQSSQEAKIAQADIVIDTNGLMVDTEQQFRMAWEQLPDPTSVDTKLLPSLPAKPPKSARSTSQQKPRHSVNPASSSVVAALTTPKPSQRPDDLVVRRARPLDVASMLLLIQKATNGTVKMKRADLLMALSERGYFIGQIGAEVSAVIGWSIDSQVARIDQIFIHPLSATATTGLAILEEVEKSANAHICEIIVGFVPDNAPDEIRQLFAWQAFAVTDKDELPSAWQEAITESQPENTQLLMKVLRDRRLKKG